MLVDSEIIAARVESGNLLAKAGFRDIAPTDLARDYAGLTFKDILLRIERRRPGAAGKGLIAEAEKLSRSGGSRGDVRAIGVPWNCLWRRCERRNA